MPGQGFGNGYGKVLRRFSNVLKPFLGRNKKTKPITLSFDFGATDTTKDQYIPAGFMDGWARAVNIKIPSFSGTLTATITVYDGLGEIVYTKALLAKGTSTYDDTKLIPLCRGAKVNILLTAAAGSVGTVVVTFYTID